MELREQELVPGSQRDKLARKDLRLQIAAQVAPAVSLTLMPAGDGGAMVLADKGWDMIASDALILADELMRQNELYGE